MKVKINGKIEDFRTVEFDVEHGVVRMIEQNKLPHEFEIIELNDHKETSDAIRTMVVRGAPAIGVSAGFGLAQACIEGCRLKLSGPEFDKYAAMLGGGFLEPVMGSIWQPNKIMYNPHYLLDKKDRWTIDFLDRVVNPLGISRYGMPSVMRSWIDHILVSPELEECIVKDSAGILHERPKVPGLPDEFSKMKGTDHHPPYVTVDL